MKLIRNLASILSPRVEMCGARLALLSLLSATVAGAQAGGPTQSELAEITARGRALAEYDFASLHGTDAVVALKPPPGSITRYIARPTEKGWKVAFGRLNPARDTFFVAYEAIRTSKGGTFEGFTATAHSTPIADTGYYVRAARALETAGKDFGPVRRSYNTAALPRPDGNWWVYLLPAQTVWGVFPLGADARYLMSADGRTILERRRLHNSVIEFNGRQPPQPGATMQAGTHTAVVAEIPEDTDVMHVLVRTPRIPEYVMTDNFVYRIDPDGKINYLGTR
jgi:hypothetical protein